MTARANAGAAYATAVTNFWDAMIELHGIEWALQNARFKTVDTPQMGLSNPDPIAMRHAEFNAGINDAPDGAAFNWIERARARSLEIIANGSAS